MAEKLIAPQPGILGDCEMPTVTVKGWPLQGGGPTLSIAALQCAAHKELKLFAQDYYDKAPDGREMVTIMPLYGDPRSAEEKKRAHELGDVSDRRTFIGKTRVFRYEQDVVRCLAKAAGCETCPFNGQSGTEQETSPLPDEGLAALIVDKVHS